MITSNFANGFKDTYKGKRDVTAAWGVFNKETGSCIVSGHRINLKCAQSTGRSNMAVHTMPRGHMMKHYNKTDILKLKCENEKFVKEHRLEAFSL